MLSEYSRDTVEASANSNVAQYPFDVHECQMEVEDEA